jgi:hypothetical protein
MTGWRRSLLAVLAVALLVGLAIVVVRRDGGPDGSERAGDDAEQSAAPGEPGGGEESPVPGETERSGEVVGEAGDPDRVVRTGVAERTGPLDRRPAPGWAGEELFGSGNDWEPAVAADPSSPHVVLLTTRYSGQGPLPCERCDIPAMALRISNDDGKTFGSPSFIPPDRAGGQYDPQIASAGDGSLYAAWINGGFRIVFSRSTDHGHTWSAPVVVSSPAGWGDHPWLGVSRSGKSVYIGFNHAASWVAQSHDFGHTWEPAIKTSGDNRYYYANGTAVSKGGRVVISQANYPLNSHGGGPIQIVATRSSDGGATWKNTIVDVVQQQPDCTNDGCPKSHLGGHAALGVDNDGDLVIVYDGSRVPKGPQYIYTQRSTDGGKTWGHRQRISPAGKHIIATEPAAVGTGNGDFRVWWMDDRDGIKRWNTFYKRSTDGGRSWSKPKEISEARGGTGYKHGRGFDADYGDYGEIAVTDTGGTIAVWGEGFSYAGPGGTWFNRTR